MIGPHLPEGLDPPVKAYNSLQYNCFVNINRIIFHHVRFQPCFNWIKLLVMQLNFCRDFCKNSLGQIIQSNTMRGRTNEAHQKCKYFTFSQYSICRSDIYLVCITSITASSSYNQSHRTFRAKSLDEKLNLDGCQSSLPPG